MVYGTQQTTSGSTFLNDYTFTIADLPADLADLAGVIESNAVAAISYIADHVQWNGVLDFVVQFGDPFQFGHDGSGQLPSYGGIAASGNTHAAEEALSGIDANGADFDAGAYILPNTNGTLTNYGVPLFLDPEPDPLDDGAVPAGTHDFFSIFLHETMHSLGFWSLAQHGAGFGESAFDRLTEERGGQHVFVGENTIALLGEALPLATTGSRDHYETGALSPIERGMMSEFGNYEQNRWQIGEVDLAILQDLGYTVARGGLPLADPAESRPETGGGVEHITGGPNDDMFAGEAGDHRYDGAAGSDGIDYAGVRADFAHVLNDDGSVTIAKPDGSSDLLLSIERVGFLDGDLLFDIDSANAPAAYRLYGGAFNRTPEEAGLRYWTDDWLDQGRSLHDAAVGFIGSAEFTNAYGSDLDDRAFVSQLYRNVLDRDGETAGIEYWTGFLTDGQGDRADVLVQFTQLPEYVGISAADVENGFWVG
ncbi:DUF4214 domain-containing protein [Pararhizobium haloflavum]|uniref:DUF4214 domain-containing protein n=1 Tax=Pararhizobium haloflavum TaxID=2037914 RepID=UPI000C198106|nr:DUF4214 domain-containing protein [Pararhizobium haloflavum]